MCPSGFYFRDFEAIVSGDMAAEVITSKGMFVKEVEEELRRWNRRS